MKIENLNLSHITMHFIWSCSICFCQN